MQEANHPEREGLTQTVRLIALTDGLFATVLTVLVLQIGAPGIDTRWTAGQFYSYIVQISSSSLLSYVLTFLVAGSYWQAHHRYFDTISLTDQRLIWFNLMFLLCIGLLPFSTNLVGGAFNVVTWSAYCLNISLIGVTFIAECAYAASRALVSKDVGPLWARRFVLRSLVIPGIFLASILCAQFDLRLAGYFPLLIVPLRLVTNRLLPAEKGIWLGDSLVQKRPFREVFWNLALFFPLFVYAFWLIWTSSHPPVPK
jgi:uncharacterized membrane protein